MSDNTNTEERKPVTEEDMAKIQWVMQLYGFIKNLQRSIEKKEQSRRYIAIFVSGAMSYFVIKILHQVMETQSDVIVFFGAFVVLCLHYIIDQFGRAYKEAIAFKGYAKALMDLENERIELGIEESDLGFDGLDQGDEEEK
jgi:hypothetical protein